MMTPEIKAAIEKEADRLQVLFDDRPSVGIAAQTAAEYGYRLCKERYDIAIAALERISKPITVGLPIESMEAEAVLREQIAQRALKELGEL